jgi:DNA-binding NarL/FixJ family response regulator
MKSIVLIDSYPMVRDGFSLLLKENLSDEFAVLATDCVDHLNLQEQGNSPDVIVLGINGQDTLKTYRAVRICSEKFPDAKLMMYADQFSYKELVDLIHLDVSGFVLKSCDITQVFACIREIQTKERFFCSELLGIILSNLSLPGRQPFLKSRNPLSAREREIADYLVQGMKTSDIAQHLGRKSTTISSIKGNLFRKMNVNNVVALNDALVRMNL